MLTPDYLDKIPDRLTGIYLELENDILKDIAERISRTGKLSTLSGWQLERLNEIKQFDSNYKKRLAELTGKSQKEIERLFTDTAMISHSSDRYLFDVKNKPYIPFAENLFLQQLTKATIARANEELMNITRTMGMATPTGEVVNPATFFQRTLDKATMQVATGVLDYDTVIKRTVGNMVDSGITTVNYESGRKERIESVVRRTVLTGVSNMASEITWQNIRDLDIDHVETSAHNGARTGGTEPGSDHQEWQGRIFALNGYKP